MPDPNNIEQLAYSVEVDACHLRCPLPLLKAKQALRHIAYGEVVKVLTTDAAFQDDFIRFAHRSGHQLLQQNASNGVYTYWIKKQ